jgi:hypothetical protein
MRLIFLTIVSAVMLNACGPKSGASNNATAQSANGDTVRLGSTLSSVDPSIPAGITYPDPWALSYKQNRLSSSISRQFQITPGQEDRMMIKDSMGFDENGKAVIEQKNTVTRYARFDGHGFIYDIAFSSGGQMMKRYFFTYENHPAEKYILQRAFMLKNMDWNKPASLADTTNSFPPVKLGYDSHNHIITEIGAGQRNIYTYDSHGYVSTVSDSSEGALSHYKGPVVMRYTYTDDGRITGYGNYTNGVLAELGVFSKPGLADSIKVTDPTGKLIIYKTFKYTFR